MAAHAQTPPLSSRYSWIMLVVVLILVLSITAIIVVKVSGEWRPNDVSRLIREGVAAYRDGRYQDAAKLFADAQRYAPEDPLVYIWSAQAKLELGMLDEALAEVERALGRFPGQRMNLLDLKGDILTRMGRPREAIDSYRQVIREGPRGYWEPWLKLGRLLEEQGNRLSARETYRELLRINPASEEAQARLRALEDDATTKP